MLRNCYFCRSVTMAGFISSHLIRLLRRKEIADPKSIIGLYHSETLEKHKLITTESLTNQGPIKVVVATSALGCGVNMKDIRYLVHFSPAFHVVDYCQQIGRAGRSGEELCHAILYSFPNHGVISKPMKKYIAESTSACLRSTLFSPKKMS